MKIESTSTTTNISQMYKHLHAQGSVLNLLALKS